MENVKIISDNNIEMNVNGLFYIFDSKYYFIYTMSELDDNEYVKLYVVQVCKEIQNTPTGPVDTGYMVGMEISNAVDWAKVQSSITKIVDDKKNNTQSNEIQYLPANMLVNLKIISNNKFKLMRHIVEDNFKVTLLSNNLESENSNMNVETNESLTTTTQALPIQPTDDDIPQINSQTLNSTSINDAENIGEVIIDYRARFFEEQEKNQTLEQQIKVLNEKLSNIKNIIG